MMVLFGFSSNGSSTDVFHISTLIPYDSIQDTPSCHHPLCHPPPLPPLKESIVIFILPNMFPKVQFPSCPSPKKRTDINKSQTRKKVSQKDQLLNGSNCEFQRPSASPLFSPSLLAPSLGSSSCSHKAT